jgi:hypothetical protein
MRNRIFGEIGVAWDGLMLVSAFLRGRPQGSGSLMYASEKFSRGS